MRKWEKEKEKTKLRCEAESKGGWKCQWSVRSSQRPNEKESGWSTSQNVNKGDENNLGNMGGSWELDQK